MAFVTRRGRYRVRVSYGDTDRAQVVHHAAYLRYLELARVEMWREHGLSYRRFEEETGAGLPVVEARLRYRLPARFDDELEVETWVREATRASVWFSATIRKVGEPDVLLESQIRLACVHMAEGALRKIPDSILDASLEPGWEV